MAMNYKNYVE